MRKKTLFVQLFLFGMFLYVSAAKVDTITTYSSCMNKQIKAVVITPDTYDGQTSYPVFYLLHGYGGNYTSWVKDMPSTKALADRYQMMIVCPDGNRSWYLDSPIMKQSCYETYIAKELTAWVDRNYKTIAKREGRAISGLSMGGHGGLFVGFRNQDVFGACGSMSGGVDIRPFPNNWSLKDLLGVQPIHPENWEKYTVINQLHLLTPKSMQIIIDCGTEDFFYDVNVRLHQELLYRNIPHDFVSRPGKHDRIYWDNAVKYQALFFAEYFR